MWPYCVINWNAAILNVLWLYFYEVWVWRWWRREYEAHIDIPTMLQTTWDNWRQCASSAWSLVKDKQPWRPQNIRYPLVMTNIAIENGQRNSEFSHWKLCFSIAILNYQRVSCFGFLLKSEQGNLNGEVQLEPSINEQRTPKHLRFWCSLGWDMLKFSHIWTNEGHCKPYSPYHQSIVSKLRW